MKCGLIIVRLKLKCSLIIVRSGEGGLVLTDIVVAFAHVWLRIAAPFITAGLACRHARIKVEAGGVGTFFIEAQLPSEHSFALGREAAP